MIWKVINTEILWKALDKVSKPPVIIIMRILNHTITKLTLTSNKTSAWKKVDKELLLRAKLSLSFRWQAITNLWSITIMEIIARVDKWVLIQIVVLNQ